ncbi:MAG: peptidylprolyl isomerase, partial [Thermoguttaceae bacterium]
MSSENKNLIRRILFIQPDPKNKNIKRTRTLSFECLEEREVLNAAPILQGLPADIYLTPGTSYHVALDGYDADKDKLTFTVNNTNNSLFQATILEGNQSVKFTAYEKDSSGNWKSLGDIIFELFEDEAPITTQRMLDLIEGMKGADGKTYEYDGTLIHRIIDGFMIQGGDVQFQNGYGGTGIKFKDEYNKFLQHSGRGIVSTANSNDPNANRYNTNDSQFFITDNATTGLNGKHNVFGFVTEGYDVYDRIATVQTYKVNNTSLNQYKDAPINPIKMDNFTVFEDNENGTLRLYVPENAQPGKTTVTVYVSDGVNAPVPYEINVNVVASVPKEAPTWIVPTGIDLNSGQTHTFTLPEYPLNGGIEYKAAGIPGYSSADLKVVIEGRNVTVTAPKNGGGIEWISVEAISLDDDAGAGAVPEIKYIPLYVTPSAPKVSLLESSDTGTKGDGITSNDGSAGNELYFEVSDVVGTNTTVTLYKDGYALKTTLVSSVKQENGLSKLKLKVVVDSTQAAFNNGTYTITAVQTFTPPADFSHAAMTSPSSAAFSLVVASKAPVFIEPTGSTMFDAELNKELRIAFRTDNHAAGGVKYSINSVKNSSGNTVEIPTGMKIDASTGVFTWTPATGQVDDYTIEIKATDGAGNSSLKTIETVFQTGTNFTITGDTTVSEGEEIVIYLEVNEDEISEGETYVFTVAADSLPAGAQYTMQKTGDYTAVFRWVTNEADGPATYTPVFKLTDSNENVRRKNVQLTVKEVNTAPVFTNQFENLYELAEHNEFKLQLTANDVDVYPNSTNPLLFTIVGDYPEGMTLDPQTGLLKWTPGENCGGFNFEITIRVTDKTDLFAEKTLHLFVEELDRPPVFDTETDSFATNPNKTFNTTITAHDPDYSTNPGTPINRVVYSFASEVPEGMTIDSQTGAISWAVPQDFLVEADGTITIILENKTVSVVVLAQEITATGSLGLSTTKDITITVNKVQPLPPGNTGDDQYTPPRGPVQDNLGLGFGANFGSYFGFNGNSSVSAIDSLWSFYYNNPSMFGYQPMYSSQVPFSGYKSEYRIGVKGGGGQVIEETETEKKDKKDNADENAAKSDDKSSRQLQKKQQSNKRTQGNGNQVVTNLWNDAEFTNQVS